MTKLMLTGLVFAAFAGSAIACDKDTAQTSTTGRMVAENKKCEGDKCTCKKCASKGKKDCQCDHSTDDKKKEEKTT